MGIDAASLGFSELGAHETLNLPTLVSVPHSNLGCDGWVTSMICPPRLPPMPPPAPAPKRGGDWGIGDEERVQGEWVGQRALVPC